MRIKGRKRHGLHCYNVRRRAPPRYGMPGDSRTLTSILTWTSLWRRNLKGPYACDSSKIEKIGATKVAVAIARVKPSIGGTPSPDVSRGHVLILVPAFPYELGASCPKFSGLQAVPATLFPFVVRTLFIYVSMHQPFVRVQ